MLGDAAAMKTNVVKMAVLPIRPFLRPYLSATTPPTKDPIAYPNIVKEILRVFNSSVDHPLFRRSVSMLLPTYWIKQSQNTTVPRIAAILACQVLCDGNLSNRAAISCKSFIALHQYSLKPNGRYVKPTYTIHCPLAIKSQFHAGV